MATAVMNAKTAPATTRPPFKVRDLSLAEFGRNEIRLTFVDVATGRIRSEPAISPGVQFVNGLLTYFDQTR